MPERAFLTETWDDEWFQELDMNQRYLFIYLWTNNHVNQAGAYRITLTTMAFETKFSKDQLKDLLPSLSPKVEWYPEENYLWVRNFIKRQTKSPKFLVAAAKCLKEIRNNGLVKEVIEYNLKQHSISIPYRYGADTVSVGYPYTTDTPLLPDTDTGSDAGSKRIGVVEGEGESGGKQIHPSESEIEESLSDGDREVISVWRSVKGFKMDDSAAAELVVRLRTEFPDLDILHESKIWAARKLSEPLKTSSRPSSQIWHWMVKAREFAWEDKKGEQANVKRVAGARPASDFRGKW